MTESEANASLLGAAVNCIYIQGAPLRGRPTPPATLAQAGKVHQITRSGQEVDDCIYIFMIVVVANWRP